MNFAIIILLVFELDRNKIAISQLQLSFIKKTLPEIAPGFEIMTDTQPVYDFNGEL